MSAIGVFTTATPFSVREREVAQALDSAVARRDWRKRPRVWSQALLAELDDLVRSGYSDREIAGRMGRTEASVKIARYRKLGVARQDVVLSARTVAERLGIACAKTVTRWIVAGWLPARHGTGWGKRHVWIVNEEALLRFLEDRRHWHLWEPERITDEGLRLWLTELRAGDRLLTTREVGDRLGVLHSTVHAWIDRGVLPAVRRGNWLIWESTLDGFVPPCERSKKGQRIRRWTAGEDAELLRRRAAGETWAVIGTALGRTGDSAANRWYTLNERERNRR